jgi:ribonuclease J
MTKKKKNEEISRSSLSLFVPSDQDLVFIPLGGTDEIGMNMALIGHNQEWIIIDCGVSFYDRLGVELLTADPSFIVKQKERLKGIFLTHAHEDHIGAVEFLWPILQCPVYCSPFTAAVLKQKIGGKSWANQFPLHELSLTTPLCAGHFSIEALPITHSVPEALCFIIRTPLGTLVHTGDWLRDSHPVLGKKIDEKRLQEVGKEGVLAYFSDSTNIFNKKDSISEKRVRERMIELIQQQKDKRIFVSCFSSNIARIETVFLAANKAGRKVAIVGRSLQRMMTAAKDSGYLKNLPEFVDEKTAVSMPSGQVIFLCTGSQGEPRSALVKIAQGEHPIIKLNVDDLILFSSRVIPGNEKSIGNIQSLLARAHADIVTSPEEDIHASGHPSQESLQHMYEWLHPKIVVPVHGEARHIMAQAHFAKGVGIPHVLTPMNGAVVQLAGDAPQVLGQVPNGIWAVDGKRMVTFNGNVMKERKMLAEEGVVFVTLVWEKDAITRTFVKMIGLMEPGAAYKQLQERLIDAIHQWASGASFLANNETNREALAQKLSQKVLAHIGKRPVVEVCIIS